MFFDEKLIANACVDRNVSWMNFGLFTKIIGWVEEKCEREFPKFFDRALKTCVDQ